MPPTRAEFARALRKIERRFDELREDFDELRDKLPAEPSAPVPASDPDPKPGKKDDDGNDW